MIQNKIYLRVKFITTDNCICGKKIPKWCTINNKITYIDNTWTFDGDVTPTKDEIVPRGEMLIYCGLNDLKVDDIVCYTRHYPEVY